MKPYIINVKGVKPYTRTVAHELNEHAVADFGENEIITVFASSLEPLVQLMEYIERGMVTMFAVNTRLSEEVDR